MAEGKEVKREWGELRTEEREVKVKKVGGRIEDVNSMLSIREFIKTLQR